MVARLNGVQKVVSSNLTVPTTFSSGFCELAGFPNSFLTHDAADAFRYLVATETRSVVQRRVERDVNMPRQNLMNIGVSHELPGAVERVAAKAARPAPFRLKPNTNY